MSKCNCTMTQKLVGDGCENCNPALVIDMLELNIQDLKHDIAQLQLDNARLLAVVQSLTLHDDIAQELWTTCFSATELDKLCVLATQPTEYNPFINEGK